MDENIRVACQIIIHKEKQILLGKRKNCAGEGSWALPGGHVEYNEKLLDAAQRELKEELDVTDCDLKLIAVTDDLGENWHYVHAVFLLDNFSGKVKLNEPHKCSEWKFYSLHALPQPLFPSCQNDRFIHQGKDLSARVETQR